MEYRTLCRRFGGRSLRRRAQLGLLRNGLCQCCPSKVNLKTRGEGFRGCLLVVEAKGCLALTYCDPSGNFDNIMIKRVSHVIQVRKDERLAHVEAHGNDILCILPCKALYIVDCKVWLEEKLFVVGQLNHQGDVKDVLKPPIYEFVL